jgi:acetyl esterase/lipase
MARDPELATFLEEPFPNDLNDVVGTRLILATRLAEEMSRRTATPEDPSWRDEVIAGPDAATLTLRIYGNETSPTPRGALLFFHGGAFVFGGLESEHDRCLRLANGSGCVVVSVDYRLAPENPFPAAFEDAECALRWLFEHAVSLGIDSSRIGVGGASAGGALAALVVLHARDSGSLPVRAQLLIYPATDDRAIDGSITQFERSEPWDGERTRKMWPLYLADDSAQASCYASPARAKDVSGLPITYILVAEEDPLRDQALDFARRLLNAGVSVDLRLFAGTYHGFDVVAPNARLSQVALKEQHDFVRRELGGVNT